MDGSRVVQSSAGVTSTGTAPSTSRSFVRWAILGSANTAVSIVGLWVLVDVIGVAYGLSAVMLHLVLISNLYVWTARFVFDGHRMSRAAFLQFHSTYLAQLVIQLVGLWLLIGRLGVGTFIAQAAVITVAALFSFVMQRYVVFRLVVPSRPVEPIGSESLGAGE